MRKLYPRRLKAPTKTFMLFGPRGTGKTTWIKSYFAPKVLINLLHSDLYFRYKAEPSALRKDLSEVKAGEWVVIDEAQRVPDLLNEIHSLYEDRGIHFAITGSSARKLRQSQSNLLAGRALRCDFFPFVHAEVGDALSLEERIEFGSLPTAVNDLALAQDTLAAYVETYLKEEIAAEAVTRQLESFARFLRVAAQHHGQLLNVETIARESSVKRRTVDNYFEILEDTLLGYKLPALHLGWRAREAAHPKFYFFDAGVARACSGWIREAMPDAWRGFSFETLVLNELRSFNSYEQKGRDFFHYHVSRSFDVDIIIETKKKVFQSPASYIAIEVKLAKKWQQKWSEPLIALASDDATGVSACYGVYLGAETIKDGPMTVLPFDEFSRRLWAGEIF